MLFFSMIADFHIENDGYLSSNKSAYEYFVNKEKKCGLVSLGNNTLLGAIQLPVKPSKQGCYAELPGSSYEDQNKIIELFSTMGSHNLISLFVHHKSRLMQLGKEIEHVHPLMLLGVVFSTPNMKKYMDDIYNDHIKWKNFIDGLEPNLNLELSKNNLLQYVDDFAKHVNVSSDNIRPFFNSRDWRGLVKYLIYN